jgi:hypothetical protein
MSNHHLPLLAVVGIALAGCLTVASSDREAVLKVEVSPITGENGVFNVRARNLSGEDRCIPMDVIQLPGSTETRLYFLSGGHPIPRPPSGYILPPLEGRYQLAPGRSVEFQVDSRGRYLTETLSRGDIVVVNIGIPHWNCAQTRFNPDDVAWSDRVAIRYRPD